MFQIQVRCDAGEWHGERRWYFSEYDAKEIGELIYRDRDYRVIEVFPVFGRGAQLRAQLLVGEIGIKQVNSVTVTDD